VTEIKYMSIKEFRELGLLQELNRLFLHPCGLALEIVQNEDGTEQFGGVWDYRDDPIGMEFGAGMIDRDKADRVAALQEAKFDARAKRYDRFHNCQPINFVPPETP